MGTNIIITKPNGDRVPMESRRTATSITAAKQTWALNAEDTIAITVVSPFPQSYGIGDAITVFGRDYRLNRLPKVKKSGFAEYQYDLEFEGIQYDLLRVTYDVNINTTKNELQDIQGDSLTGDLKRFMDVLISNANRVFPGKWALGECPETVGDKTLTFAENDNCLSVLQNLCSADNFGVEFDIVKVNGVYTINLYEKVGSVLPFTLEYGKGKGLYSINRDNVSSSNIITRLKVFGSTENITSKYRADRLCMYGKDKSSSYIEKAEAVAKYGIFEGRKNFDDIKPTFTGKITAIVDGDVLSFVDETFPFDIKKTNADGETEYMIAGVSPKVHFNSGNLAGYEFEVHDYDHATHKFTLIKQTDDRGHVFPSETSPAFQFGVNDTYKVLDIAYSKDIEEEAEKKLAEQGNKYYDENCQPKVQYSIEVTKSFVEKYFGGSDGVVNVFKPGDCLPIKDDEIGVDKAIRIKSFTRNVLDPYDYALTISDVSTKADIITRVISEIGDIDKVININNLKDPAQARANWRSSREVLNMVFDPETGGYYGDKITPESVDTIALSVGAKSMQFGLTNTVFQPNFNGNAQVVKWKGGVLTHYTIDPENARSWVLADGEITFTDTAPFYIYACCNRNGEDGVFEFSKTQHKVEESATVYYFLVGVLNSVDEETNVRSISLTYGFTMINGRFIKTGRIESADGTTYFDLDNSEIGGHIVFTSNGEQKTLEELGAEALESKNFINNTLPGIISQIQSQIDGQIGQYFEAFDPLPIDADSTTANEPAATWIAADLEAGNDNEKDKHLGDLFYNTESGKVWRYIRETILLPPPSGSGAPMQKIVYMWSELADNELAQALSLAQDALDSAREKARVFVDTPYPPYDVGDLWVQGASGDIMRCKTARQSGNYTSTDWERASKYTDNTALNAFINGAYTNAISSINSQIDGKIETWFQTTDPATAWTTIELKKKHFGDMWYHTMNKELKYYTNSYSWEKVEDAKSIAAYEAASNAQDTADGKRRVFVDTPTTPYDRGDLWANGTFLKRSMKTRLSGAMVESDWEDATNYTGDESLNDFIENTYNSAIADIYKQLDGVIETHFGNGVPTLENAPASEWTTTKDKEEHLGDMYYDNDSGIGYRFSKDGSTYAWVEIRDTGVAEALAAAAAAQDTADGKRRVFVSTPRAPYDVGDLWASGTFLKRCIVARAAGGGIIYQASDWDLATNYTGDENLNAFIDGVFGDTISDIYNQLDGKVESWYTTTDPASNWTTDEEKAKHVGDQWFNTSSNRLYHYIKSNGNYLWEEIKNQDAIDAAIAASKAQDTADGKRRVFVATPTVPYDVGDLWAQGETGDLLRCIKSRASGSYTASDWGKATGYTDDSALSDFVQNTYNPNLSSLTNQIDGKIETWFQTTDPASRWTTNAIKAKHVGDMWYHTTNKELRCYRQTSTTINNVVCTVYGWALIEDSTAISAYEAASKAQDTADGKRRVFVATPTVPYDVGDLWVDGKELRRCITAKTSTQSYNVNDWVIAVNYDNTKTTIDGGIVTSGTIQVAGDNNSILAGITGNGTAASSIRFWAGASFENRATAPFRVQQDGAVVMTNARIEGDVEFSGFVKPMLTKITSGNFLQYAKENSPELVEAGLPKYDIDATKLTGCVKLDQSLNNLIEENILGLYLYVVCQYSTGNPSNIPIGREVDDYIGSNLHIINNTNHSFNITGLLVERLDGSPVSLAVAMGYEAYFSCFIRWYEGNKQIGWLLQYHHKQ